MLKLGDEQLDNFKHFVGIQSTAKAEFHEVGDGELDCGLHHIQAI
jgi:hypothetical protein